MVVEGSNIRLTGVLSVLGIATSSWYCRPKLSEERQRPGPRPQPIDPQIVAAVVAMAKDNPWYGYKRIARTLPPCARLTPVSRARLLVPSRRPCRQ